jgi:hypothetical protein
MTPHVLLLHLEPSGSPFLITIQAITTVEPRAEGCMVYSATDAYWVREDFDTIVATLGGLVMKPIRPITYESTLPPGLR